MNPETNAAHDLAAQIALAEMVRVIIGEAFFTPDRNEFRRRLCAIESAIINGLNSRQLWKEADAETETYVKEAACGYVTTLIASIRHPDDVPKTA